MQKLVSVLLAAVLCMAVITGCSSNNIQENTQAATTPAATQTQAVPPSTEKPSESETQAQTAPAGDTGDAIRIGGLKGPTSMGMVKLMQDAEDGTTANNYEFTITALVDEMTAKLIQGELDMAALPANLASVLYNNTKGGVSLLAVNTLGVIYIVDRGDSVNSVADLKGKTIYATGKGSTPEFALNYILQQNGLDPASDLTVEWKTEATEVVAALQQAEDGIAMLPQPFVTVAQTSIEGLRIALDLTKEWDALDNGSTLITGVLVVRTEFAKEHADQISTFLDEYKASAEYANSNVDDAAALIEKYDIVKAAIAKKALPYCNITFMEGEEMKAAMNGYLQTLYDQAPAAVGGAMPDDAFYYER